MAVYGCTYHRELNIHFYIMSTEPMLFNAPTAVGCPNIFSVSKHSYTLALREHQVQASSVNRPMTKQTAHFYFSISPLVRGLLLFTYRINNVYYFWSDFLFPFLIPFLIHFLVLHIARSSPHASVHHDPTLVTPGPRGTSVHPAPYKAHRCSFSTRLLTCLVNFS